MIFAVSMTFIDQTIVAISLPTIQEDVHLSTTGSQWIINGYLLSLSALFAFGGRLADIAGHRRMVVLGVDHLRRCLGPLRRHPDRLRRRGLADHLPHHPGRGRGDHVPGGAGDRPRGLPGRRARPRDGDLLRHRRRPHLDRPDRRRLPHRVDLALDLLDQRPGRDHRPLPHLESEARRQPPPGQDRLQRHRPRLRRHGPARPRPAAVGDLGLGRRQDLGLDRARHRRSSSGSSSTSSARATRCCGCGSSRTAPSRSTAPSSSS